MSDSKSDGGGSSSPRFSSPPDAKRLRRVSSGCSSGDPEQSFELLAATDCEGMALRMVEEAKAKGVHLHYREYYERR